MLLLVNPPSLLGYADELNNLTPFVPNTGLLYLCSVVEQNTDIPVKYVDMAATRMSFRELSLYIKEWKPTYVGISAKTFNILSAYTIAGLVKECSKDITVFVGGAHGTVMPRSILDECPSVDAVFIGESETSLVAVINSSSFKCAGVMSRAHYFPSNQILDITDLPYPDYTQVDMGRYKRIDSALVSGLHPIYSVFGSRGCPYSCAFCWHEPRRQRTVTSILDEVEYLHVKYGARIVIFEDNQFFMQPDWFESFCAEYMARGLHEKVEWGMETRIDLVTSSTLELAKKAGCFRVYFGVESVNPEVLKLVNKKYRCDAVEYAAYEAIRNAWDTGIRQVIPGFIFGLPGHTRDNIRKDIEFIHKIQQYSYVPAVNILCPYPGTEIWEMADRGFGGLRWVSGMRSSWNSYSRNEPMLEVNDLTSSDLVSFQREAMKPCNY
jgi:anaerobic magnesium-protoporphyrin IX monomethyl ester cyclase